MSTTPSAVWQMAVSAEIAAAKWLVATSTEGLNTIRRKTSAQARPLDVGYESATQFSREYARAFGLPPSQDAARILRAFRASPA